MLYLASLAVYWVCCAVVGAAGGVRAAGGVEAEASSAWGWGAAVGRVGFVGCCRGWWDWSRLMYFQTSPASANYLVT